MEKEFANSTHLPEQGGNEPDASSQDIGSSSGYSTSLKDEVADFKAGAYSAENSDSSPSLVPSGSHKKGSSFIFNIVNIIGSIGIYAILAANNITELFAQVNVHISPRVMMVVSTAIMCIPTLFAKTLAETLLVSLIGTLTSVIVTIVIIAMACLYPIRNGEMHVGDSVVRTGPISHFGAIPGGFAMAISSVTFAYLGTTIVPHIEGGMRRPEKFNLVFGSALSVIAAVYVVMAATGYWAYGDRTLSPITLNFPKRK
ncbi:hypothetical protein H4S02_000704 [Coemansia sp. RSA 2611]|nr:hypothetical protein H4S02_000704 [Coemansia sp. RSA 2611]